MPSMLFSPYKIQNVTFRNRVAMPPMVYNLGDHEGRVTDAVLAHYGQRADAGTGMVIVEATCVDPGGRCWPKGLNIYDDAYLPGLSRLAARIHAGGARAGIQLVHGGPQASPALCGGEIVGPSAVAANADAPLPRPLTLAEIQAIEERFADAAARAVAAGFDSVEVHGAHGFLLDSFLSTRRNTRADEYGGTLAGRMRFLVESCRKARERIGASALLDCRLSFFNKRDEGFTADDLRQLVTALENAGLDLMHVSTDGAFKGYFGTERTIGQWVKESTNLPLIVCGGLGDPHDAERLVAEGHADFAAVGQGMLKDPEWTRHARELLGV